MGRILQPLDVSSVYLAWTSQATKHATKRAALKLVRMAIEQVCPAGVLPSEEWVTGFYGPEPIHEGEALAKAVIETVERLTR